MAATKNKKKSTAHSEELVAPRTETQGVRPKAKEIVKITKLETFLVKPRWLFLKMHTNAGVMGWGEPITEGRALTCATAVKEIEPYLIGKDPRNVAHHWQAIYRHAFYRGGPILTSALSGIDQALWDIKGKLLDVPVYELLGEGYIKNPFKVREGFVDLPTGPGLGIEIDEEGMKARDLIGHDWKNQESYDADDGSVVDW